MSEQPRQKQVLILYNDEKIPSVRNHDCGDFTIKRLTVSDFENMSADIMSQEFDVIFLSDITVKELEPFPDSFAALKRTMKATGGIFIPVKSR